MNNYDSTFFQYVNAGATKSALALLPVLTKHLSVHSVLDVGCGQGAWLSIWSELGVKTLQGLDGDYVNREHLLFPRDQFLPQDLRYGFDLGRRFDIVQSLEVAEHLPAASAASFINSLVAHGDLILFSAAPRGQGGDDHVNEQPYEYWRRLFAVHGYVPLDFVRPRVAKNYQIEPWYRDNTLIYASTAGISSLPDVVKASRVPNDQPIRDFSPPLYKLRKACVALLPVSVMTRLAKMKEQRILQKGSTGR